MSHFNDNIIYSMHFRSSNLLLLWRLSHLLVNDYSWLHFALPNRPFCPILILIAPLYANDFDFQGKFDFIVKRNSMTSFRNIQEINQLFAQYYKLILNFKKRKFLDKCCVSLSFLMFLCSHESEMNHERKTNEKKEKKLFSHQFIIESLTCRISTEGEK